MSSLLLFIAFWFSHTLLFFIYLIYLFFLGSVEKEPDVSEGQSYFLSFGLGLLNFSQRTKLIFSGLI